jgi:magnesium-transporting ATPase (P-type)
VINLDYVASPIDVLFEKFHTSQNGLSHEEAQKRLEEYGFNEPAKKKKRTALVQLLSKFTNPLVIVYSSSRLFLYTSKNHSMHS